MGKSTKRHDFLLFGGQARLTTHDRLTGKSLSSYPKLVTPLRIALFILGLPFAYFFGETLEKFLLEVIRIFVPVEPSNALLFNLIYLLILLFPLFVYGGIVSISLSGEPESQQRFRLIILSIASGIIVWRIYHLWWLLRGVPIHNGVGVEDEVSMLSETFTPAQLYFLENLLPYIILGLAPSLVVSCLEKNKEKSWLVSLLATISTFIWLYATNKLQNLTSLSGTLIMLLTSCFSGLSLILIVRKIRA